MMPSTTPSDIAIHRSVRPCSALFPTRQSPRCCILSTRRIARRKRDALATSALPGDISVFADAALATQSAAVASFPPAASFETAVYAVSCYMDSMVQQSLAGPTPATFALVGAAGLATSMSPCTLSVLPLTIGYISGYSGAAAGGGARSGGARSGGARSFKDDNDEGSFGGDKEGETSASTAATTTAAKATPIFPLALAFAAGTATTLAAAGVAAAAAGTVYLGIGGGGMGNGGGMMTGDGSSPSLPFFPALFLPLAASVVAVGAGANLLGLLRVPLPGVDLSPADSREASSSKSGLFGSLPPVARAFAAGAGAALAASPCSTPVLATLLTFSASSGTPLLLGGGLLFAYAAGVCVPLVAAAMGAGAVSRLLELRQAGSVVQSCAGVVLIAGGVFSALDRLLP